MHSAFRQFANKQKGLAKGLRDANRQQTAVQTLEHVEGVVQTALQSRGIEDVPRVELLNPEDETQTLILRKEGAIVLRRDVVVPPSGQVRQTSLGAKRVELAEKKAIGIAQLLHGMGLLSSLSFEEQEKLIRDILEIVLLDNQA